jgi:hypothetical protein
MRQPAKSRPGGRARRDELGKRTLWPGLPAAAVIGLTLLAASAEALTFHVDDNGDAGDANPGDGSCATAGAVCTLRAAIEESNATAAADTVTIPPMTITLGSTLTVTQPLTIDGYGPHFNQTILDGNNAVQIFFFQLLSGPHTISDLRIQNANAAADGGGVWNGTTLTISAVTFINNRANQGGAVFNNAGSVMSPPNLRLNDVTFTNIASTSTTFGHGGGAIFNGAILYANNIVITGSSALQGAAFYNNSSSCCSPFASITGFAVSGNTARYGGGIDNDLGTIYLTNGTITGNTAQCCDGANSTGGGGIYNNLGTMTLNDVAIIGNQATSPGGYEGGIYSHRFMTLNRVSLTGNRAAFGAGIYNGNFDGVSADMSLTNVTVSGNIGVSSVSPHVDATGAGIYNTNSGHLTITNSTIAFNTGAAAAGGIENLIGGSGNTVTLRNSILANNSAATLNPECRGTITSGGNNIVLSNAASCAFTPASGDQVGVDPRLLSLIGNPAYHPLRLDSTAMGAANGSLCPDTDERGLFRPKNGACDIGAYEAGDVAAAGNFGGGAVIAWSALLTEPEFTLTGVLWTLSGTSVTAVDTLRLVPVDWQLQRLGDFNGDGQADFLWRERDFGWTYLWLMSNSTVSSEGFTTASAHLGWEIQGVGDFDGDGRSDILWRNQAGALYIWFMNGTTVSSSGFLNGIANSWQVQAVADFNGDGKADILWRELASGSSYLWLMNRLIISSQGYTSAQADNNWVPEGVGDISGDGKADILWRFKGAGGPQGLLFAWFMNGTAVSSMASLGTAPLEWEIGGVANFDGGVFADILWRQANTGSTYLWLMNGATISSQGFTSDQADTLWQFRHPR